MSDIFIDVLTEKTLLSNIIKDVESLEIALKLTPNHFTELSSKRLFDLIVRYYKRYGKLLPQRALEIKLQKEHVPYKECVDVQLAYLEAQNKTKDDNTRFYIDRLGDLKIKRELHDVYNVFKKSLEDESAYGDDILSDLLSGVLTVSRNADDAEILRTQIIANTEDLWKEYEDKEHNPDKYKGIPLGFNEIDDALLGGILSGWLGLIFARTGVGKSRMLFNIAGNIVATGKSVMYITIEMEAKALQHMWASRTLKIPFKEIVNATLSSQDREFYKEFLASTDSNVPFTVIDIPRGCSPSTIESEIMTYTRVRGKKPDIVLIDYVNLMHPNGAWEKEHEKYGNLLREIKQVARIRRIPIITAMQQNRDSLKAKHIGLEHIALSDQASHHCDFVINLRRDDQDKNSYQRDTSRGYVIAQILKARYGELKSCRLFADFACNYITDPFNAVAKALPGGVPQNEQVPIVPDAGNENDEF